MIHSKWLDFTEDFGDGVGGILIGFGVAKESVAYGVVGLCLFLVSIYLKFYHKRMN